MIHPLVIFSCWGRKSVFQTNSAFVINLFVGFSTILSSMMKREAGSKTLRSERVLSRGDPNFNGNLNDSGFI